MAAAQTKHQLAGDTYTHAAIEDLPDLWDGLARLVRTGLGVTAFGVQIMDLPPNYVTGSHDELETGQQELYAALRGSGAVVVHRDQHDDRLPLDPGHVTAVAPGARRTLVSGPEGVRVLCVGAAPGEPYSPPEWTTA